jgi:hypothetical protein
MRQRPLICVALAAILAGLSLTSTPAIPAVFAQTTPTPLSGFPRTEVGEVVFGSPTVVDIDGNGRLDVLVGDQNGCVWGFDRAGVKLASFPWATLGDCKKSGRISSPLAVGDVDGDGRPEVAAGTRGSATTAGSRGKTFVWNRSGQLLAGWPKEMDWEADGNGLPEVYGVVLANMTGDARLEVLAGTSNNSLNTSSGKTIPSSYVWTGGGQLLAGWPTGYRQAGIYGTIGAGDLNRDGYAEYVAGRDQLYVHAYNAQGQWLPGWPVRTYYDATKTNFYTDKFVEFTDNPPAMGDLDGDGSIETVIAGKLRDPLQGKATINMALFVLRPDGSRFPGWELPQLAGPRVDTTFLPRQEPALADLDGDGKLEIVVAFADGTIRAYRQNATQLWSYNFAQGKKLFASEPAIGDVTGDGLPEVLFGTYSPDGSANASARLIALDRTGKVVAGYPLTLPNEGTGSKQGLRAGPTLADLDGNGTTDIVAGSQGGTLYAWNTGAAYRASAMPWPTGRGNIQRTGFFAPASGGSQPTATTPPASPTATVPASPTATVPASPTATAVGSTPTATRTATPGPTAVGGTSYSFGAAADTFVDQAQASSGFGNWNQLNAVGNSGAAKTVYIRFTVSGLPSGAAISGAKLRLWVINDSTDGGDLYRVSSTSWAESVSWNGRPALDTLLLGQNAVSVGQLVELDVTSQVLGNGSYSFALVMPSGNGNTVGYASREHATTSYRPQLVITTR